MAAASKVWNDPDDECLPPKKVVCRQCVPAKKKDVIVDAPPAAHATRGHASPGRGTGGSQYTSKPNATGIQLADGKLTVTVDAAVFSTAAQYPFRTVPTIQGRPEHKVIAFENPLSSPPEIIAGLNLLDFSNLKNPRIKLSTTNITNNSFQLNATTWLDTIVHNVGCDWLAVNASDPMSMNISTGIYNTAEDPAWTPPIRSLVHPVRFQKPYHATPTVAAWICGMDMGKDANLRLRIAATDVTAQGFNISIYSWSDTIVDSVIVSWVAYPCGLPGIESGDFGALGGGYLGWQIHGFPTSTLQRFAFTSSLSGQVQFHKFWNLTRPPRKVLVAFTMFDLPSNKNFRLKLACEGVTKDGMVWKADSWGGSEFVGLSGTFIALA
ncbi:hypothetical protein BDZ91DRAFT_743841 [Kalaharituber pfeilii]|nr:hypothetical protein BDZ91DRAFT_743841 [Kalaharituber pfeilii]